jgi:hypothetical protein
MRSRKSCLSLHRRKHHRRNRSSVQKHISEKKNSKPFTFHGRCLTKTFTPARNICSKQITSTFSSFRSPSAIYKYSKRSRNPPHLNHPLIKEQNVRWLCTSEQQKRKRKKTKLLKMTS